MFIAVEGGEGSGKSSLVRELRTEFGRTILVTREPGGSPYAETITKRRHQGSTWPNGRRPRRRSASCSRRALTISTTSSAPSLEEGKPVVTDRLMVLRMRIKSTANRAAVSKSSFGACVAIWPLCPTCIFLSTSIPRSALRRVADRNQALISGYDNFDDRRSNSTKKSAPATWNF